MTWPVGGVVPDGWQIQSGYGSGVVSVDGSVYRTGTHSVKFVGGDGVSEPTFGFETHAAALFEGDVVSFWIRGLAANPGTAPVQCRLEVEDLTYGWNPVNTVEFTHTDETWTNVEFTVTSAGNYRVAFNVSDWESSGYITFWVDDFEGIPYDAPVVDYLANLSGEVDAFGHMSEWVPISGDHESAASVGSGFSAWVSIVGAAFSSSVGVAATYAPALLVSAKLSAHLVLVASIDSAAFVRAALRGRAGVSCSHTVSAALMAALSALVTGLVRWPTSGGRVEDSEAEAWVINTQTRASTRYENYGFNSFALIAGRYYGCRSDGIYELDGETDAGQPVQAMVSFGKQDFGTSALKRVTNLYVGTSSGGKLFVKVLAEGEEYLYQARDGSEELQVQRFDLGRGLRANYLEFELYNTDGDDFELASVEFVAVPLSRRI